jgi:hypothetical protein
MGVLGLSFLAIVICSIILGKEVSKKIKELEEKANKCIKLLSDSELKP